MDISYGRTQPTSEKDKLFPLLCTQKSETLACTAQERMGKVHTEQKRSKTPNQQQENSTQW